MGDDSEKGIEPWDRVKAYHDVFNSPQGHKVLEDLMAQFNIMNSSYKSDVNDMIYREGSRAVILFIFVQLDIDHSKLRTLIQKDRRKWDIFDKEDEE